ncbi:hypothetical protein BKA93DRAFT_275470 [Sparassis latifolia]|uniref:Cyclin N-terminal domain-containing protein n=1 Tax=Sparassis crispa TaxID=139825 RepID=A0A401GBY3_9APHY|nr:hypothetical protein SCP_0208510 [Sparassis crispa]GBE79651.1 hypothetical protein SCP_0208510 [Sparassis crispa]
MPVPVPLYTKQPAHPVIKTNRSIDSDYEPSVFQHLTQPPLPPRGPPPSLATREEWISSLPSWRRNKPRRIWEEDIGRFQGCVPQDFEEGLAVAGNAAVSKGAPAQACIPPVSTLVTTAGLALSSPLIDMYPDRGVEPDHRMDIYSPTTHGWPYEVGPQFPTHPSANNEEYEDLTMENDSDSAMDYGQYDIGRSAPLGDNGEDGGSSGLYIEQDYQRGAFSPVFEDISPERADMHDPASSPMGPATPFADFVDRAVAEAHVVMSYDAVQPVNNSREMQYGYHDDYSGDVCYECQAYRHAEQHVQVQVPVPEPVVTPTATTAYKRLAEPLSEWIATYVWKVCTTGTSLPPVYQPTAYTKHYSSMPPSHLASSTHAMLLSTLLQPSAVYLALWYIVHLPVFFGPTGLGSQNGVANRFVAEFLGEGRMSLDQDAIEAYAPFRLILLGCMLANKWLDDHTFSNKTWHTISHVPVQSLNRLESLALDLFDYDLSISPQQWSDWLSHLLSYHASLSSSSCPQPISRPSMDPHTIIRKAIETLIQAEAPAICQCCNEKICTYCPPEPIFVGIEGRRGEKVEVEQPYDVDVLEIDLDEDGPLREEYLPRRRISGAGSTRRSQMQEKAMEADRILPPPAKWSPSADEPIMRDGTRAHAQYVAVQPIMAVPPPPPLPFHQVLDPHRQTWSMAGYVSKQEQVSAYGVPVFQTQAPYIAYDYTYPLSQTHSRSQSLSYHQAIDGSSQGRVRSYSQSRYEPGYSEVRFSYSQYPPPNVPVSRWLNVDPRYAKCYDAPIISQQRTSLQV